ncbi:MAG: hypothetical protein C6I00_01650 [Nitratiruptor sp.]|nr:hypothetical protein [Nitratiruptor sp.]NPA83303.1 hypothetical protein [Campylobacterota bacterium]
MGNKLVVLLLWAPLLFGMGRYPEIDELIEKIKIPRQGLTPEQIAALKDPFIGQEELTKIIQKKQGDKKRPKVVYRLQSIFGKRAKINGRWYRLGAQVGPYRLVAIRDSYVLLRNGGRQLKLFLWHKRNPKLKIIKIQTRSTQ